MTITTHEGKLFAERGTGKPTEMLAEAPDLFFVPASKAVGCFAETDEARSTPSLIGGTMKICLETGGLGRSGVMVS